MTYQFSTQNTEKQKPKAHRYFPVYLPEVLNSDQRQDVEKIASNAPTQNAMIGQGDGINDPSIRKTEIRWLTPNVTPSELAKYFEQVIMQANAQYWKFNITGMEAFQYSVYNASVGGHYNWHTDMTVLEDGDIRKLSMSLLLNDPSEYEGGNLLLNVEGNIMVAREKVGQAIFFPSWMPHCVTPVTKGVRRSLVSWVTGPEFK
jgi:PKHD-type hydroxylase